MTRARAGAGVDRTPNALMAEYYMQRASAGLSIAEATAISDQALGWVNSPGIYSEAHTAWVVAGHQCHSCPGHADLPPALAPDAPVTVRSAPTAAGYKDCPPYFRSPGSGLAQ